MSNSTSLTLLERVVRQDSAAWDRLAAVYEPLLQRWLAERLVQPEDAADLAQQILLVVHRKIADFRHAGGAGAFRSWLRGITVREVRAHRQREFRLPPRAHETALDRLADAESELSRQWDAEYDRHVLGAALDVVRAEFESQTWNAFRLTAVEGKTAPEAAAELGVSANAVRLARSRVLRRLRTEMDGLLDL